MASWFHMLCMGFIALMLVVGTNGCDCSRSNVRKVVCASGSCSRGKVDGAITLCLLRCKKKRTDPMQQLPDSRHPTASRSGEQLWDEMYGVQSGETQCLLDDIYHKLTPSWQKKVIEVLKQAASGTDK